MYGYRRDFLIRASSTLNLKASIKVPKELETRLLCPREVNLFHSHDFVARFSALKSSFANGDDELNAPRDCGQSRER
jgi:hypothetical protein